MQPDLWIYLIELPDQAAQLKLMAVSRLQMTITWPAMKDVLVFITSTIYWINLISRPRHWLISGVKRYFGRWNRLLTCIHVVAALGCSIYALLLLLLLSDFSTLKCIIERLTPAGRGKTTNLQPVQLSTIITGITYLNIVKSVEKYLYKMWQNYQNRYSSVWLLNNIVRYGLLLLLLLKIFIRMNKTYTNIHKLCNGKQI